MFRIALLAILAAVTLSASRADPAGRATNVVDLQLVLAADNSGSVSASLRDAQRLGFAAAFRDATLQNVVASRLVGKIAVVYFAWAGQSDQQVIVPWTILSGPEDMARFAETLEAWTSDEVGSETSISGAMMFADRLLAESGFSSTRKVVDISGNGTNSEGLALDLALRALRASGATVNGLVLPAPAASDGGPYGDLFTGYDEPLVDYYRKEVIGGPGAFAIEVDPARGFSEAILRKLVREIAWAQPGEARTWTR